MENLKLPITVIGVIVLQIGGFIWWTAQQAATISTLEETVAQLSASQRIQDKVNMQRDIEANGKSIDNIWEEADELWDELEGMLTNISAINNIKQRIATIETELKYLNRDHNNMNYPGAK